MKNTDRVIERYIELAVYKRRSVKDATATISVEEGETEQAVHSFLVSNGFFAIGEFRSAYKEGGREAVETLVTAKKAAQSDASSSDLGWRWKYLLYPVLALCFAAILVNIYSKDESERRYENLSEEGKRYVDDEMKKYDEFCAENPRSC